MAKLDNSVLNGTNEVTNQDIGQIRVFETENDILISLFLFLNIYLNYFNFI